ncbi:hypothetical protein [Glutamicibacter ardleyensis]|uniref:Uncharacterized protein n=1 Tax=Glutamicibacter ardleyensis TaxID=225894 RepID=A0ABQ2DV09_9MICC|nr:hypothetical protein [Glutamicibacter ardleyensis]GGJ74362.1 hypothetical protein GCM10007173_36610 [Glutamicibacter ardleyensis]
MARKPNLNSGSFKKFVRNQGALAVQTPLSRTAVERGSTRWLNGSTVVIEGLLDVTGTFNGSGTNNLDGTNNLSGDNNLTGPTEISGSLDVTGPTTLDGVLTINGDTSITGLLIITGDTTITGLLAVDGPTTISGTLDIDGVTTLNNDLNVTNSGEINVGTNMTLTPSADGGSILFQDGSKVTSVGGVVRMIGAGSGAEIRASLNAAQFQVGSTVMGIDSAGDWFMQSSGTTFMSIGSTASLTGSLDVSGKLTVGNSVLFTGVQVQLTGIPTTANKPNVHISGTGYLYKSTFDPAAA